MTHPIRLATLTTVVAVSLAACSSAQATDNASDAPDDLTPVTVVLDWTPNTNHTGLYLALANGWYEDAGLDVTVIEPGETSGLQLLAAGQADFAYSVAEGLLPARAAGADVVSLATVIEHNTSSLISLTSDGITRPRDLEGKRYGSYGSALEEAIISSLVACDGGDPALVEHTPLVSDDFRIGLTQDQFDVAWVMDAWDTIRLSDVDAMDVSTIAFRDWFDCIPDWYTPLIATSADQIAEHPETVRAFVEVTARGYGAAMEDPQAAADALMAAAPELDEALVTASAQWLADQYADAPETWGVQERATWEQFSQWLTDGGMLDGDPGVGEAWTNEFLPAQK
ncbi:ABC transporter substrate-binding protein [Demequina sp. TTPB684]|uniref:ABC transporter substrate-binding protein n=1 Tax=unclassified Demequina TaxID=2620311 RepID=UPI001CF44895|nr:MULTISPECIES: ABC transporter substrate-binding protein [unclassified Demequina]MCB2413956.1 ABC transporter substrate-binding protein [Demequina sp. TTPB684]UPU88691.1 ABC transporter substrate-binding protein [Demequina sp. TMPB413]